MSRVVDAAKLILGISLVIAYLFAVMPFIVHSSFSDAGVVVSSRQLDFVDMPNWAKSYSRLVGTSTPVLLEVEHRGPTKSFAILTDQPQAEGGFVAFHDPITRQVTDWRTFDFAGFEFDEFVVTEVQTVERNFLNNREINAFYTDSERGMTALIILISTVAVVLGPIILSVYVPHLLFQRVRLWQIVAAIWLYAYTFTLWEVVSTGEMAIGIVLLLAVGVIILHLWRYEKSERGRTI